MSGPEPSEEEHEIVLTEERPVVEVVEKENVPVERERLGQREVGDSGRVDLDVRDEPIASAEGAQPGPRSRGRATGDAQPVTRNR